VARFFKDNGLTIVLLLLFSVSLVGQWLAGWSAANQDLQRHSQPLLGPIAYLADPAFLSSVFENWESEFLQMSVYVVLTAYLFQRGSSESKDPDETKREVLPSKDPKAPALAKVKGATGWLYSHSLGLALGLLFGISFGLHWMFSAQAAAQEAIEHGQTAKSIVAYLGDPQLWFESFQNWQSEFLSTAVLVVLSIFLRQKNSPESKPVASTNCATGSS
jgi:hypothetical protein